MMQRFISTVVMFFWFMSHSIGATGIEYDALQRLSAVVHDPYAESHFNYDDAGNRTGFLTELKFGIAMIVDQQINQNTILSVPLAATGALATPEARWSIRSSNHALVPKSGIQVEREGTLTPIAVITPTPTATGTSRITLIASDGSVGAATSFMLTVGINRPPRAIADTIEHPPEASTRVERRRLLLNDSDPDGDPFSMTALSTTSAHGGVVEFFGPFVRYAPPAGYEGPDLFHYTLTDSRGASATGTVTVNSQAPSLIVPITVVAVEILPNDHRLVRFIGPWNTIFEIQASTDLVNWSPVGTSVSDERGRYVFEDSESESHPVRFYRSVHH